jgi:hypothetical protein
VTTPPATLQSPLEPFATKLTVGGSVSTMATSLTGTP